jgi:predicted  nucleic acid-binding Zn-ribbon protein
VKWVALDGLRVFQSEAQALREKLERARGKVGTLEEKVGALEGQLADAGRAAAQAQGAVRAEAKVRHARGEPLVGPFRRQ